MDMMTIEEAQRARHETDLAREIADYLTLVYSGYKWACTVDLFGGVVHIYNMNLSGKWGFTIKVKHVIEEGGKKRVRDAGGELLERYRLSRRRLNEAEYMALPTNAFGELIADK